MAKLIDLVMMIIDDEAQLPTLPGEIIREIVSYIPITTEIRTYQALLVTSRQYGLFYISESCKAFLSTLQCYIKSNLLFSYDQDMVSICQLTLTWLNIGSRFDVIRNFYHFHTYVDGYLLDKETQIAPFLSFMRLTQSYIKECTLPILFESTRGIVTPIDYTLKSDTQIGFIYYADKENIVHPIRKVDNIMVLQKPMRGGGDWKKTLNYGGWLTKGCRSDHLEQVVYKGKFIFDTENVDFLSRCFYFGNDRGKAQIAYQFYHSAKEGPFRSLLDEYPD